MFGITLPSYEGVGFYNTYWKPIIFYFLFFIFYYFKIYKNLLNDIMYFVLHFEILLHLVDNLK